MTRGQRKAKQSGQVDQGAEQQGAADADHDMHNSDMDAHVDQVVESAKSVESEQSDSSSLGAESDFKARVRAAYVGKFGVADSDYIKDLVHKDGLWFAGQALVVPRVANLRHECMKEMHDMLFSGHLGVTKTLKAVTRLFWWPVVKHDVKQCVLSCNSCHRTKSSNQRRSGFLVPSQIPDRRCSGVCQAVETSCL